MSLLDQFIRVGSPATPAVPAAKTYPPLPATASIQSQYQKLLDDLNRRKDMVANWTTQINALKASVAAGDFTAFAASQITQSPAVRFDSIVSELCAVDRIASVSDALITALTAQYVTPYQNDFNAFKTAYASQLAAAGLA